MTYDLRCVALLGLNSLELVVHRRSYVNSSDSRSSIDSLLREIVTQWLFRVMSRKINKN